MLCLWMLFSPSAISAPWLTVKGTALFSGTDRDRARQRAVEAAHREAIYQTFGKDIAVEDLFVTLRLSGSIMGAIPCGRVVASEIRDESLIPITSAKAGSALSEYRVELRAQVDACPNGPPSSFWLDANLNKTEFVDGDPVVLNLWASDDCYYYIFNILEDEKVLRLLPNRLRADNRLRAHESVAFPTAGDEKKGVRPLAHLPQGVSHTREAIYVLALRRPVDFSGLGIQEGIFGIYDGRSAFIQAMIRVVATIPVNERAEKLIRYQICAKTK
jgi:hypothetical protein